MAAHNINPNKYSRILFLLLLFIANVIAQETVVSGKVMDSISGMNLSNVNIYLKDNSLGTTSDKQGLFRLSLNLKDKKTLLMLEHVGYETLIVSVEQALKMKSFLLQPVIINTETIGIRGMRHVPEILKDIAAPLSIIDNRRFEIQGYVDIGDLLKTDQSIQIEEELSGKKTISLRAGNADDVVILYNGIKMNSAFDNTFDLSFIDLEDIETVEIIKGSNTALYGSGAFSGIVNIIPKMNCDYLFRFQQKFGSYNTGEWNLQFNRLFFDRLNFTYSLKESGSKRKYEDSASKSDYLQNDMRYHQASIFYKLGDKNKKSNTLNLMYLNQKSQHNNYRNFEDQNNSNEMITLNFTGDIFAIKEVKLSGSFNRLNTEQTLATSEGKIERDFLENNYAFNAEKKTTYDDVDFLVGYQFQNSSLDYTDQRHKLYAIPGLSNQSIDLLSSDFSQQRNGIISIVKFHAPTGSDFIKKLGFGLSYRQDWVQNRRKNFDISEGTDPYSIKGDFDWQEPTIKFSTSLAAKNDNLEFDSYINFGTNVKFPSMYQQISTPSSILRTDNNTSSPLKPEEVKSLEIGGKIKRKVDRISAIDYWQFDLTYFKNYYTNKFVSFSATNSPISYYDNSESAVISGFDIKGSLSWFDEKLILESGASLYDISDVLSFPFKYETKTIFNVIIDYYGFYSQIHWFNEGEQTGMILASNGRFEKVYLSRHSNIDVHISKSFEIMGTKFFTNLSARNLLDDITVIEGIAIRDKRVYMTFGFEY